MCGEIRKTVSLWGWTTVADRPLWWCIITVFCCLPLPPEESSPDLRCLSDFAMVLHIDRFPQVLASAFCLGCALPYAMLIPCASGKNGCPAVEFGGSNNCADFGTFQPRPVEHKPDSANAIADALSRRPDHAAGCMTLQL
eukprot:352629-Chlamydomonas_euryale.AAC.5